MSILGAEFTLFASRRVVNLRRCLVRGRLCAVVSNAWRLVAVADYQLARGESRTLVNIPATQDRKKNQARLLRRPKR
jgi:hypothetical protein